MTPNEGSAATRFGYDGNGNQIWKYEQPQAVPLRTTYGYDLDNRLRTVSTPAGSGEVSVQWASTATASTQYSTTSRSASRATGAPDKVGCGGTSGLGWSPTSTTSLAPEWLRLEYATPTKAVGVRIHETNAAPFVKKVELIDEAGTAHEVWAGTDFTMCDRWLDVKFPETEYLVKAVKITTGGVAWEEIDAVGLVSVVTPAPMRTSAYEYDANGLRTYKSDSAGETRYLLDGLSVIAQYAMSGQRQAWYTQSLARIDEVLNVVNDGGKQWYQADALGSIYGLTNASGALIGHQGYDVFGTPDPAPTGPAGQPFGFTGREHELDSGLVYARARYLNPAVGRWDRPDPLGMIDGPNRYGYARSGPTRFTDPQGLFVPITHRDITRQAFEGVLTGADLSAVVDASVEADNAAYQFEDHRHGMRAANVTLEEGARRWADFVDDQLGEAVELIGNCEGLRHEGLRQLGFGAHALEDFYSPPHHMRVMRWLDIREHLRAEENLDIASGPARLALASARDYAQFFRWALNVNGRWTSREWVSAVAWAYIGQLAYIDAVTQ